MAGKIATTPKIINSPTKEVAEKLQPTSMEDIIAKTISETLKAVAPLLAGKQAEPQEEATTSSVRTKIIKKINQEYDNAVKANTKFMASLVNAPESDYVKVIIPRVYKPYFGPMLPVGLNGSLINIPIDNRPHKVHKAYLPIILQKLRYEDEKIDFMNRTGKSDVFFVGSREDLGN